MRVTAIQAETERKRQDRSVRCAEERGCRVETQQFRGPIRPIPVDCATADTARGEKYLFNRQNQAISTTDSRPLGEYRFIVTEPHSDPWLMLPSSEQGEDVGAQEALQIETIENVQPLDRQFGINPKKSVPAVLHNSLFGQPEPTEAEVKAAGGDTSTVPPMQTYAILDAAKVVNLPELLDASRLEHRCLFIGAACDDLKNVAPWIVRLEDGNDFTRRLFTGPEGINGLWDMEPGIYVRSRASLDEMWRHFRKFTRVRDGQGKWHFFKFWEARSLCKLSTAPASHGWLTHLLYSRFGQAMLCGYAGGHGFRTIRLKQESVRMDGPLVLTPDVKADFVEIAHGNAQEELALSIGSQSGDGTGYDQMLEQTRQRWRWLQGYGMTDLAALKQGSAALLKISTDEILRNKDIQDVVKSPRLGDRLKARLIERAVPG